MPCYGFDSVFVLYPKEHTRVFPKNVKLLGRKSGLPCFNARGREFVGCN
jgi:hypothetical protein